MTVFIYTLSDPRTNEVRYVGKTVNPKKRFHEHVSPIKEQREGTYKRRWTAALRADGLKPTISIIDRIENSNDEDWQCRERFWISHYRRIGARLTNLDSGGLNGKKMSEESKEKCRLIHLGKKRTPEAREKMRVAQLGKKRSLESRIKQSEANKAAWVNRERKMHPNALAALCSYHSGRKHSVEQIRKRVESCSATRMAKKEALQP